MVGLVELEKAHKITLTEGYKYTILDVTGPRHNNPWDASWVHGRSLQRTYMAWNTHMTTFTAIARSS